MANSLQVPAGSKCRENQRAWEEGLQVPHPLPLQHCLAQHRGALDSNEEAAKGELSQQCTRVWLPALRDAQVSGDLSRKKILAMMCSKATHHPSHPTPKKLALSITGVPA